LRTSENASAIASIAAPSTKLFVSLMAAAPSGFAPAAKVRRPISWNNGSQSATASGGPPATIPSWPAAAASGLPSTGADTRRCPASPWALLSAWIAATLCVPMQRWIAPGAIDAISPPGPRATSLTAVSSDTIETTTSRSRHASAIEPAIRAPAPARSAAFSGVRLYTTRSWPPPRMRRVIPWPILPRPTKPTLMHSSGDPQRTQAGRHTRCPTRCANTNGIAARTHGALPARCGRAARLASAAGCSWPVPAESLSIDAEVRPFHGARQRSDGTASEGTVHHSADQQVGSQSGDTLLTLTRWWRHASEGLECVDRLLAYEPSRPCESASRHDG